MFASLTTRGLSRVKGFLLTVEVKAAVVAKAAVGFFAAERALPFLVESFCSSPKGLRCKSVNTWSQQSYAVKFFRQNATRSSNAVVRPRQFDENETKKCKQTMMQVWTVILKWLQLQVIIRWTRSLCTLPFSRAWPTLDTPTSRIPLASPGSTRKVSKASNIQGVVKTLQVLNSKCVIFGASSSTACLLLIQV